MSSEKQQKAATTSPGGDIEHPKPPVHSDNENSKMPERHDDDRKRSPADRPGKKPGEGEPSVG
ncbi:hypothetical protein [Paraburkholderia caribensis]|jgi:hypothetical protein|uniref:Uncharacterized protein n=1 Tax=Paraburkholderia caribensis TaxID=75105 RepID=A0A9Q6RYI1_9BURK|nr:hypothetical protein [Paraburkholderia caribensis]ALP63107.1 hypothetical protein AN416_11240 [Paraburkholderia caribensis]AUT51657.1 hypothetical protein C2L66_07135 [Paraburkholderia caribensis]MCO4877859.1 hypothetical protein [Paraburkholderia caribensis]PTB22988.1 hypothetical protein C9I56_41595 [Paraburkholderia caribensis]QLB61238.1 hypothetical protein A9O66_01825 [Paraburkholderia caribensis]